MVELKLVKGKLTKYEKARIIGARALQLSMGAPFLIKMPQKKLEELKFDCLSIAKLEFEEGVILIDVLRNTIKESKKDDKKKSKE